LFGLADATLATTGLINASTQLASFTSPVKVVFFDFDKTLVVGSSDVLLKACDPTGNCNTYYPAAACTCNGTHIYGDFLVASNASSVLAENDVLLMAQIGATVFYTPLDCFSPWASKLRLCQLLGIP